MTVRETQLNPEQKAKEQSLQYEEEKEFVGRLAQSLDLPSTLTEGINEAEKEAVRETPKEVKESKDSEEVEDVEDKEEEAEEQGDEDSEESEDALEEDEDLIPKSKVQKRFDELTAQLKQLRNELAKEKEAKQVAPKDSQEEQLEKMSEGELKTLKRQVRLEQIKAQADEVKLNQLLDLEEKIDRTMASAPQKFTQTQVSRFNSAVQETAESMDGFDSVKNDIFNHAKSIYESSPELQSSVSGQERAWKFAVDHFKALQKLTEGKSDTTELKRQVNTLKKKISVDTTSKKAVQVPDSQQRQLKKAIHGDEAQKVDYMRRRLNTDSFVSEDELRNFQQ